MKKAISLLSYLLLSSMLFWSAPTVEAQDLILKVPGDTVDYCHMKFPAMREETLSWSRPVLDEASGVIDFYGPCDYDPSGIDEIRAQRRVLLREYFNDGD